MRKNLTYGMVGAALDSFIGAVHRVGAGFDGIAFLKAGCFSRNEEKNKACSEFYYPEGRCLGRVVRNRNNKRYFEKMGSL